MKNYFIENIDLYIIPNVNSGGRKKVEEGYTCWRSNPNKIDPNRNYDFGFNENPN